MSEYYLFSRAGIIRDYITVGRASELLAEAQENEVEAGLRGDLETGFCFWSFDAASGLRLIRYQVEPVSDDDVPEDGCDHQRRIASA